MLGLKLSRVLNSLSQSLYTGPLSYRVSLGCSCLPTYSRGVYVSLSTGFGMKIHLHAFQCLTLASLPSSLQLTHADDKIKHVPFNRLSDGDCHYTVYKMTILCSIK